MDPYGSVWSLRTPWGLPGASWGPGGSKKGGKGVLTPGGGRGALLGGLPISPSWANRPPISLRGILTYMPARAAYGFFPGHVDDDVPGYPYPHITTHPGEKHVRLGSSLR